MGAVLSPPLIVDHPAICKTSWRVGETAALVYKYAKQARMTCLCYCISMFSVLRHPGG